MCAAAAAHFVRPPNRFIMGNYSLILHSIAIIHITASEVNVCVNKLKHIFRHFMKFFVCFEIIFLYRNKNNEFHSILFIPFLNKPNCLITLSTALEEAS